MKHEVVDQRSLELNTVISQKITRNPRLLAKTRQEIIDYLKTPDIAPSRKQVLREWLRLLNGSSLQKITEILTGTDEESCRLRQSSPFTGILTQRERLQIFKKYEALRT